VRIPTKPWYRASKDAWYVEINGRQVRLAKGRDNEKAARDAFYKLMANGSGKLPEADTLRVATVCDLFLDHERRVLRATGCQRCHGAAFAVAEQPDSARIDLLAALEKLDASQCVVGTIHHRGLKSVTL
jgi:hypothetical protein